jgi:hypothetical protein
LVFCHQSFTVQSMSIPQATVEIPRCETAHVTPWSWCMFIANTHEGSPYLKESLPMKPTVWHRVNKKWNKIYLDTINKILKPLQFLKFSFFTPFPRIFLIKLNLSDIRPFLCFSLFCVRVRVGFGHHESCKILKKQRKISMKKGLFMEFSFNRIVIAKVL